MRQFHGGVNREEPDYYGQAVSTCASAAAAGANLSGWTSATECSAFAASPVRIPAKFKEINKFGTLGQSAIFELPYPCGELVTGPPCAAGKKYGFPLQTGAPRDSRNFACRQRVQSAGKSSVSKSSRNTIQVPYPGWWRNSSRNLTRRKD